MPLTPAPPSRFASFSTSTKMLFILTLALLPLGVIASLASFETARANRAGRVLAARLLAGDSADRLNLHIERVAVALRGAARDGGRGCRRARDEITDEDVVVSVATVTGRRLCGGPPPAVFANAPAVAIDDGAVVVAVTTGTAVAAARLSAAALARASHPSAIDGSYELGLSDRAGRSVAVARMRTVSFGRDIVTRLPVADGQLGLSMRVEAAPLSANELLLMLLPLLMWVAAAATGWLIVDRLILRPLGEMQLAVDRWRAVGGRLTIPPLTTPAREIRDLGGALTAATETIARHETELEEGLARQTRLTREVHHRVKNNLQVVASLLNIHARGARAPEAQAAYGSIQRRVDALALVHRNHYAELEVNRGLALRPLIGELATGLRASTPSGMAGPRVVLDLALYCATQDIAVPVAFVVTELVELAMFRVPGTTVTIGLRAADDADRARLTISSPALARGAAPVDEAFERCERVVGGLARQLRTTLARDEELGLFGVDVLVIGDAGADGSCVERPPSR